MTTELEDVLIVDDDEDICEILAEYVKSMGMFRNVVSATDGSVAIDKLRNQQFSLILLDLNLPRKNGLEVLEYIGGEKGHSLDSVIMISGEFDENKIKWIKAIINSMTPIERKTPEIINGSRRKRIAIGSGRTLQEVNQLLKQFNQMKTMMTLL